MTCAAGTRQPVHGNTGLRPSGFRLGTSPFGLPTSFFELRRDKTAPQVALRASTDTSQGKRDNEPTSLRPSGFAPAGGPTGTRVNGRTAKRPHGIGNSTSKMT